MPEKILVVPRKILFGKKDKRYFEGFQARKNLDFENIIKKHYQFILRKTTSPKQPTPAERDKSMKQIIPYIVFRYRDKYFVYKRLPKSGEERLREKYSMGIGGHINPIDVNSRNILWEGMKREFEEEIDYHRNNKTKIRVRQISKDFRFFCRMNSSVLHKSKVFRRKIISRFNRRIPKFLTHSKIIGFINDDKDSVGRVHFGVVFLVEGSNDRIDVKEKDKLSGEMMTLFEAKKSRDKMEGWSQIVFDWLKRNGL